MDTVGVHGIVPPEAAAGVVDSAVLPLDDAVLVLALALEDADCAGEDETTGAVTVAVTVDALTGGLEGDTLGELLSVEPLVHAARVSEAAIMRAHNNLRDMNAPPGSDR